jgi:hypothetical protein
MTNGYSPQGWYVDPTYPGGSRYWNGASWTAIVARGGITFNAPIDPSRATLPPVAGTQVGAPPSTAASRPVAEYTLPDDGSDSGTILGVLLGVLVAFFVVLMIFAIISNESSTEQSPSTPEAPPATEAPPADGG